MSLIKNRFTVNKSTDEVSIKKTVFLYSWCWSFFVASMVITKLIFFPSALIVEALPGISYLLLSILSIASATYLGGKASIFSGLLQTQNSQQQTQYTPPQDIGALEDEINKSDPGPAA